MDKKIFLTPKGLEELKSEHKELLEVKRPQVVTRLSNARDMGDLSENAEYTAARDELVLIDSRIEELEDLLKKATLIKDLPKNKKNKTIDLGSKVKVKRDGKTEVFTIVGEWESDPGEKMISNESPLGKALLGKSIGEDVEITAPVGKIKYKIAEIE